MAASGSGGRGGGIRPELGGRIAARECESCRSAPGIPFCRVEWSFLCTGCAAVVHGHNWIVAVPPNPNPNPNPNASPYPYPYAYPYPVPNPNLNPNPNAGGDPNQIVQLSSDEEAPSAVDPDDGTGGGGKRRRRSAGGAAPGGRVASVMRYKEKRKSRKFDKTVRYETRKMYADLRPRVDGKFARPDAGGEEARADAGEAAERRDADERLRSDASEEARANSSDEVGQPEGGEEELRQLDAADEGRLE
ncbi:uncharacterized protein [Elaeis guineensis]|uniref:Uncharacterized protein LOC105054785 n=1 Tax=Elaeis guineensis var. tenera TaxID=51953 RepID=A0A6I9RYL9_ELAGV|nr:uncharacterized protein LOC105054785 [Elaeis guineensis]